MTPAMSARQRYDGSREAWERTRPSTAATRPSVLGGAREAWAAGRRERPTSATPAPSVRFNERLEARDARKRAQQARHAEYLRQVSRDDDDSKSATEKAALDRLVADMQVKLYQKRGNIAEAFRLLDANGDGTVSRHEIAAGMSAMLNREISQSQINALMMLLDTDNTNSIDLNEFVHKLKIQDRQTRDIIPKRAPLQLRPNGPGRAAGLPLDPKSKARWMQGQAAAGAGSGEALAPTPVTHPRIHAAHAVPAQVPLPCSPVWFGRPNAGGCQAVGLADDPQAETQ